MKQALIVNLYAGPGALKSTIASGVFTLLKLHGVDCDAPHEFPKDLVWEESVNMMKDQSYIFGNQAHRIWRVANKVDVVVVDSPMLFSIVYRQEDLKQVHIDYVLEKYNQFNNLDVLIERNPDISYVDNGRNENIEEAINIDNIVKDVLNKYATPYYTMKAEYSTINNLTALILERLGLELKYKLEEVK